MAQLPRDSATVQARHGDVWGSTEHLLAAAVDALRTANWQRTKDGTTGRNPPEPVRRPGMTRPGETKLGSGSWTMEEMRIKLDNWPGRRRHREVSSGN